MGTSGEKWGCPVTIGTFDYTLDSKNRVVAPPRFREALIAEKGSHFILAMGVDECVSLFLPSQWETFRDDLKEQTKNMKDKAKARAVRRRLFSSAVEVPLDEQGRLLVPQILKDHAKLKKDVVIVGAGDKAEIWDHSRWTAYNKKQAEPSFEKLAKDLDL